LTFDWSFIDFLSCLENSVALSHITELHTLLTNSSYTHALHESSNLCKISIYRELLCWLNSELSFISLLSQLIIHACSEANIRGNIFLQIFLQFLFCNVKHPDNLSLHPNRYGSDSRTVRWHIQTRAAFSHAYVATHS